MLDPRFPRGGVLTPMRDVDLLFHQFFPQPEGNFDPEGVGGGICPLRPFKINLKSKMIVSIHDVIFSQVMSRRMSQFNEGKQA